MNYGVILFVFIGTSIASYLLTRQSIVSIIVGCILAGSVASIQYLPINMVDSKIVITEEAESETINEIDYDDSNRNISAEDIYIPEPVKEEIDDTIQTSNNENIEEDIKNGYRDITGLHEVEDKIEQENQVNTYVFVPPISGLYRFELSELMGNARVYIMAYDELDEPITSEYAGNGEGITVRDMIEGETYKIKVQHTDKLSSYIIKIGYQNEVKSITNVPFIEGNISYNDQVDIYKFTPPVSGLYRFDISELMNYSEIYIVVYNRLGEIIESEFLKNEEGITVNNMNMGEEYQICIRQSSKYSYYLLKIGYQKPAIDITGITEIYGEMTFKGQEDIYFFTTNISGNYKFEIYELKENVSVDFYIYNRLEEIIGHECVKNEEGKTIKINAGEQYKIKIKQSSKYSSYILRYSIQE